MAADPSVLVRYREGFVECAYEVDRYLSKIKGGPNDALRPRLVSHLSDFLIVGGRACSIPDHQGSSPLLVQRSPVSDSVSSNGYYSYNAIDTIRSDKPGSCNPMSLTIPCASGLTVSIHDEESIKGDSFTKCDDNAGSVSQFDDVSSTDSCVKPDQQRQTALSGKSFSESNENSVDMTQDDGCLQVSGYRTEVSGTLRQGEQSRSIYDKNEEKIRHILMQRNVQPKMNDDFVVKLDSVWRPWSFK